MLLRRLTSSLMQPLSIALRGARIQTVDMFNEVLPIEQAVICPDLDNDDEAFARFIEVNHRFTVDMIRRAEALLQIGTCSTLCHRRFSTISSTSKLSSCIGMSITTFHHLFILIEERLKSVFPHSRSVDDDSEPDIRSEYADNRFRLFAVLYRLKLACSFRSMEPIFGWSSTVLEELFSKIVLI